MHTEREAYGALIELANRAGRQGKKVYGYRVFPPKTTSDTYHVVLDARYPESTTEAW